MRNYELVLIIHPELDDAAFQEIVERISGWIKDDGGEIIKVDHWGKKQLAYPIRKLNEGNYVLFDIQMNPQFGAELERNLRFLEPVLRFLLIAK